MRRIEFIKIYLHKHLDNYDNQGMIKLLLYLQDLEISYGYATATLQAFEDNKIGKRTDQEVSDMMRDGEYDRLFDEWLNEEV